MLRTSPGAPAYVQASYTLRVFDERGPTALPIPGRFWGGNAIVIFAMYSPAAYTPLASGKLSSLTTISSICVLMASDMCRMDLRWMLSSSFVAIGAFVTARFWITRHSRAHPDRWSGSPTIAFKSRILFLLQHKWTHTFVKPISYFFYLYIELNSPAWSSSLLLSYSILVV